MSIPQLVDPAEDSTGTTSTSSTVDTKSNIGHTSDSRQAVDVDGNDNEMVVPNDNLAFKDDKGISGTTTGAAVGSGDGSGAVERHLFGSPATRRPERDPGLDNQNNQVVLDATAADGSTAATHGAAGQGRQAHGAAAQLAAGHTRAQAGPGGPESVPSGTGEGTKGTLCRSATA
eukprot:SAG11_NODE_4922_length_1721_cov_17.228730_1_plen_174_part_00